MNKTEFMEELRRSIHMLEDGEQTDIVDEYSQHIDMKVESGMTEEEAIADFGPVDQLIEEILAAYHVKAPEKASAAVGPSDVGQAGGDQGKRVAKVAEAASGALGKLKAKSAEASKARRERRERKAAERSAEAPCDGSGSAPRRAASSAANLAGRLWRCCIAVVKACARWCWNAFAVCVALCFLAGTLCGLGALGFCVVFMLQGYPLAGVTIALLGSVVAMACLALLALRFLVFKRKSGPSDSIGASNAAASEVM